MDGCSTIWRDEPLMRRRTRSPASDADGGLPSGLLRVGLPVGFGRLHVAPRIGAFLRQYPEVSVELVMNDGFVDLVGEGLDMAVRIGDLSDPTLIVRRIGTTRRVTVASHDYLARRGTPRIPADLADMTVSSTRDWRLESDGISRARMGLSRSMSAAAFPPTTRRRCGKRY